MSESPNAADSQGEAPLGLNPDTVHAAAESFAAMAIGSCSHAVRTLDNEIEAHLGRIDDIAQHLENVCSTAYQRMEL